MDKIIIENEIEKLEKEKETLPETSCFGDPNWEIIDAQITVLNDDLTKDEIWQKWSHLEDEHIGQILEAREFLDEKIYSLIED